MFQSISIRCVHLRFTPISICLYYRWQQETQDVVSDITETPCLHDVTYSMAGAPLFLSDLIELLEWSLHHLGEKGL